MMLVRSLWRCSVGKVDNFELGLTRAVLESLLDIIIQGGREDELVAARLLLAKWEETAECHNLTKNVVRL